MMPVTRSDLLEAGRFRSCRIRMVAFATPLWAPEQPEDGALPVGAAGVMALPLELANALEDGQLDLFS